MAQYLLIESRDPFESTAVAGNLDVALELQRGGNDVTLFLVQNGVLPARPCIHSKPYGELKKAGINVLADEFSLRERGIADLAEGIEAAPLDTILDALAEGAKVIWH